MDSARSFSSFTSRRQSFAIAAATSLALLVVLLSAALGPAEATPAAMQLAGAPAPQSGETRAPVARPPPRYPHWLYAYDVLYSISMNSYSQVEYSTVLYCVLNDACARNSCRASGLVAADRSGDRSNAIDIGAQRVVRPLLPRH